MKIKILALTVLASLFMVACSDDDDISMSMVEMKAELPAVLKGKNVKVEEVTVTLKNISTGAVTTQKSTSLDLSSLNIEDGVYDIAIEGSVSYPFSYEEKDQKGNITTKTVVVKRQLKGYKEQLEIKGNTSIDIPLILINQNASSGFVISEIKLEATKTPANKGYYLDTFIEIYNNSNETLYADGLCIGEGSLKSNRKLLQYSPDIREEAFPLGVVLRIPGSGKEHPVAPGKTLLIADSPINHLDNNTNSYDLSKADFEWFFENSKKETDVPEVDNLEIIAFYGRTTSKWKVSQVFGTKGYVLFRLTDSEVQEFVTANTYKYNFFDSYRNEMREFKDPAWKIANDKIIDAVETARPEKYQWKTMAVNMDLSWTHCGDGAKRYTTSIKRKISKVDGDRIVLQDTNDSASDFIAEAENPSPGTVEDHKE